MPDNDSPILTEGEQENLGILHLEDEILLLADTIEQEQPFILAFVLKNWSRLEDHSEWLDHFELSLENLCSDRPFIELEADGGFPDVGMITFKASFVDGDEEFPLPVAGST